MSGNLLRALYTTWVGWIIAYFLVLIILFVLSSFDFESNNFTRYFQGKIDSTVPVTMRLEANSGRLSGYYQYDKFGNKVDVIGNINGGIVEINGIYNGKHIDTFNGVLNSNSLKGKWIGLERKRSADFLFYSRPVYSFRKLIGSVIEGWLILGLFGCCVLILLFYTKTGPFKKEPVKKDAVESKALDAGLQFEAYIAGLLPKDFYEFRDWRSDKSVNGLHPISNTYPDLHFKRKNTKSKKNEFAIECKYRSALIDGVFEFDPNQLRNYITYGKEKGVPVFLALGIGGSPNLPEHVYIIPIMESTTIKISLRNADNHKLKRNYLFYEPELESLR